MVNDLKDPDFQLATRAVEMRTALSFKTELVGTQLKKVAVADGVRLLTSDAVTAFLEIVLAARERSAHGIRENTYFDAMTFGHHSYYNRVLKNAVNEILSSSGVVESPRSIRNCCIRIAGGWLHDTHDRELFEAACKELHVTAYNDDQYGICPISSLQQELTF